MTNPIAIAPKPAQPTGQSTGRIALGSGPAPDFAGLIAVDQATPAAPGHTIAPRQAGSVTSAFPTDPAQSELAAELETLLEKLVALSEKLKEDEGLENTDLDELGTLLAGIETLLDQGVPLPSPDTEAFAALADLATALGLAPADAGAEGATAPLDALAGLATGLADGVRKDAPELAARLTGLARTLDTHSAAIQAALADEQAIATSSAKQIESETKLNPAATIAAQSSEAPGEKPAQSVSDTKKEAAPASDRSLVKDAPPAASGAEARPASPQAGTGAAGGPAASTGANPAELDTPDGLIAGSPQAQPQTAGPQAAIRPEAALYQRPDTQINLPHIAAEISRHLQNGTSRFEIRLNPPELGRIDVRMEVDNSGNVVARLAVERSETLDLLQRDQRSLERALADAGLDSAKTELEFSLQQQGGNTQDEPENSPWRHSVIAESGPAAIARTNTDPGPSIRGYARLDAVNLWV